MNNVRQMHPSANIRRESKTRYWPFPFPFPFRTVSFSERFEAFFSSKSNASKGRKRERKEGVHRGSETQ